MWEQITTNPVNMRFHRVLWLFMEIHEIGVHITIPSFMISISPLKVSLPNNAIYSVTHSKEKVHFSYKRYSDFKRKLHTASVTMDNHVVNATHLAATSSSALYFEAKSCRHCGQENSDRRHLPVNWKSIHPDRTIAGNMISRSNAKYNCEADNNDLRPFSLTTSPRPVLIKYADSFISESCS